MSIVDDLRNEADLCRNDTENDIAELLDRAADEIIRMRNRIESLRGLGKSASGWLLNAGKRTESETVLNLIGDMEQPL